MKHLLINIIVECIVCLLYTSRSLGVHLILATQKPAGQVNDQIWSNSKFKLCLKVQTQEMCIRDSNYKVNVEKENQEYYFVGTADCKVAGALGLQR